MAGFLLFVTSVLHAISVAGFKLQAIDRGTILENGTSHVDFL